MAIPEDKPESQYFVLPDVYLNTSSHVGDSYEQPQVQTEIVSSKRKRTALTDGTLLTDSSLEEFDPYKQVPEPVDEDKEKSRRTTGALRLRRPTTPDSRWDKVRQHVLTSTIRSATPPPKRAESPSPLPWQPRTHKPSRFARFAFRQVVEQACISDDAHKFAREINRICWLIRTTELQKGRISREPSSGSSTFTTNLTATAFPDTVKLSEPSESVARQHRPSSVRPLYDFILQAATLSHANVAMANLPSESLVLSTLLIPFFDSNGALGEDRSLEIESFEAIIHTWAPANEVLAVERYLWCCNAAAAISQSATRMRILSTLFALMIPTETNRVITSPDCFRHILQGLFSLFHTLRPSAASSTDDHEVTLLHDIILKVQSGSCVELDINQLLESYNVSVSVDENADIRNGIVLEALAQCMDVCTASTRLWLFHNVLERYWIDQSENGGPIWEAVYARTFGILSHAVLKLLSISLNQSESIRRDRRAAELVQHKFIPDVSMLGKSVSMQSRTNIINIVLELICQDTAQQLVEWGTGLISGWYEKPTPWKARFETAIQEYVSDSDWLSIAFRLSKLVKVFPEESRRLFITFVLPLLHDKLVDSPPAYPCEQLTGLFDFLARAYPKIFYKPLFSCAASSKEITTANHLCIILSVARFLPSFWIRDAEMISIALMSEVGAKNGTTSQGGLGTWAQARLGQSVLILEIIGYIQAIRREKETANNIESALVVATIKFVLALESRLGILIEAKERSSGIPPSHRLLFCILFREMRLLTRSLRPASWLSIVIGWFMDLVNGTGVIEDPEIEERTTMSRIQGLYAAALDSVNSAHQRRSTLALSKRVGRQFSSDTSSPPVTELATLFTRNETLLASLSKGFTTKFFKVLVTMSTLLEVDDYRRLIPYLWDELGNERDTSLTSSSCFLVMKSAEKAPTDWLPTIEVDLRSSDEHTKMSALRKIHLLFGWRFQILSQPVVADRTKRPFKITRDPLAFTPTDVGSSSHIIEKDHEEQKDSLPLELKRRLAEIGWDQNEGPVDRQKELIKTPMSLLPTHELNDLTGDSQDMPSSPSLQSIGFISGDKANEMTFLRRNSTTGGPQQSMKRKAIFVPSLTSVFPCLASLVFDPNFRVSCATKQILLDLMRNDPSLLTRPALDLLTGSYKDVQSAVLTINAFLHTQKLLPSPTTHHIFNHLAGFLKHASRHAEEEDALEDFANVITVLARLVTQVNGVSIREIRKAKLEPFLIPSGSLWFSSGSPPGPMFPRTMGLVNSESVPSNLVSITMIRLSQNFLFLAMLKRDRQNVEIIRKNMSRIDLPSSSAKRYFNRPLELSDFVPRKIRDGEGNFTLTSLSLILSRSHLLLVSQVFRSMSRHLNDRGELSTLIDGLNRILLIHGDDIGIVGHVLIALMVACTRFNRMFTSGRAYALFMPVVLKVYTESESNSGIRLAIEYAVNRFYALHQDAFIFQTMDAVGHLLSLPDVEGDWLAQSVYNLFYALHRGITTLTPDAAGIHNANKIEEREALMAKTAEDKPQTFFSALRRGESTGDLRIKLDLPEEYGSTRFGSGDLIRLFLMVIAHDTSVLRAEQFLKLLRFMTPYLYNASTTTRSLLQEGIDALSILLLKSPSKSKINDHQTRSLTSASFEPLPQSTHHDKSQSSSNITSMRVDLILLVRAFTKAGGQISRSTLHQLVDIISILLKEQLGTVNEVISTFLTEYARATLLRKAHPNIKLAISFFQDFSPLISGYSSSVDLSGIFNVATELANNPIYAIEREFSHVMIRQLCCPVLDAFEAAPSAFLPFPSRNHFVALLAQSILLQGTDVILELLKRSPSYKYLTTVILPLVLSLKIGLQLETHDIRTHTLNRAALKRAWIRLLSYAMDAFKFHRHPEESKSHKNPADSKLSIATMLISIQIIKVIVVRAEPELSSVSGIWPRLASFLVNSLSDGSATFACPTENSPSMTPIASPLISPSISMHFNLPPSISTNLQNPPTRAPPSFTNPRIIDYTLWSVLELLCAYRTPLLLQMRLLILEKLVELDENLRQQHFFHDALEPSNRPLSGSIYTKRARRSKLPNSAVEPTLSPSHTQTLQPDQSFSSFEMGRQPGYNVSSPHETMAGPKIVHLGPISAVPSMSVFGRAFSGGRARFGRGKDHIMDGLNEKVKSLVLVRETYRRIQIVQTCMGYELLPMPVGSGMEAEVFVRKWTKGEALAAIVKETDELKAEFEGPNEGLEDEAILVEASQSFS